MSYLEPLFIYLNHHRDEIYFLSFDEISVIVHRELCKSAKQYKLYWYSKNILFLQKLYRIKIESVSPVTMGVYFDYI